jgi:16S rRNA (uracil1498-N3)-methyltransferase
MAAYDFTTPRIFVDAPLYADAGLAVDHVPVAAGGTVLVFNGRDGEWRATVEDATLRVIAQTRPQPAPSGLWCLFAAPRDAVTGDSLVGKAVEMGAGRLLPVLTENGGAADGTRIRANVLAAASQCGILAIPEIAPTQSLRKVLADWPAGRRLVFCDEDAAAGDGLAPLAALAGVPGVLIGPERGFAPGERAALLAHPGAVRLWLGPRILRADTALVAALALMQSVVGDWRG